MILFPRSNPDLDHKDPYTPTNSKGTPIAHIGITLAPSGHRVTGSDAIGTEAYQPMPPTPKLGGNDSILDASYMH